MNLSLLKQQYKETVDKRNEILTAVEARDNKAFTEEERALFDTLTNTAKVLRSDIERIEKLRDDETAHLQGDQRQKNEIQDFGEYVRTARFSPRDPALEVRLDAGQTMGDGAQGGFVIPPRFESKIREVSIDGAIFRPRATVIPAGSPPDQTITFPALDQSTTYGMYAGVDVAWIGEGVEKPETSAKFREISLTPKEVAASLFITDKLLRNAPAVGAIVQNLMRAAIIGAEEDAFMSGNGVGRPLGVQNCAATIDVKRGTDGTIVYTDLVNMFAKFKTGGKAVFIASRTILPKLMVMKDEGNNLIWQPNAREGAPGTLLGIPVIFNDQAPVLGSSGDLLLVDLSYYLIKDGSGLSMSMSEHVRFRDNQTCIKVFWNVDGRSWLNTPLLQRDGVTQISPFVSLDVAA
jgi:HK97 family phage major capsid protein